MESAIGAHERLLRAVSRRVGVVRDPQRDVVHPASIAFDEGRESVGVAGEAPLDDLLIGARQPAASRWPEAPSGDEYAGALGDVSRIVVSPMDLTWLGHACFRMRGREGIVLTDPPDPKSGHAIAKTEAAIVTISHEHPGHSSLRSVGGEPVVLRGPGEYEVREVLITGVATFHDEDKGAERGKNTVFAIRLDDLLVCHLGDLGHVLPAADLERLGNVDIALVPISGADTNLSAARAAEIIHQLEPKVDPDATKKDSPFERLLHELGVKELTPVPKLSVSRSSLPENVQVVALDSRAR